MYTLSGCEHGSVQQSSLEASASPCRQVGCFVPLLRLAVPSRTCSCRSNNTGAVWVTLNGLVEGAVLMAMLMLPAPVAMLGVLGVSIVAVCSAVYLEDDGAECDKKTNTHTAEKY